MQPWDEFERLCLYYLQRDFPSSDWVIEHQRRIDFDYRNYGEMDIVLRESRRGGRRYVVECKFYQKGTLGLDEIRQAAEYAKSYGASGAVLMFNDDANTTRNFEQTAEDYGVELMPVNLSAVARALRWIKAQFGSPYLPLDPDEAQQTRRNRDYDWDE
jgi:predicted RecB family endonuclease